MNDENKFDKPASDANFAETDEQRQLARKNAVLDRMKKDAEETEAKVIAITQSWLKLTKGFSPTAIAQAIANDKEVRDILNLATTLAAAFEKETTS